MRKRCLGSRTPEDSGRPFPHGESVVCSEGWGNRARIVSLEPGDVPRAADVIRHAFATVAETFGLTEENCPTNGAFLHDGRLAADVERGTALYGLFEAEELGGIVALRREDAVFHLEKLSVAPWLRKRGYGGALVEHAVEEARKAGAERVRIGVMYENRELVRWYERRGFVRTETRAFAHLPFVVCFMVRRLRERDDCGIVRAHSGDD